MNYHSAWPSYISRDVAARFTSHASWALLQREDHYGHHVHTAMTPPAMMQRTLNVLVRWLDGYDHAMDMARVIFAYSIATGYVASSIGTKGKFISMNVNDES